MEKIIIYVLVIAIGILYEYVKKKVRNTSDSKPVKKAPQAQSYNPFLQFSNITDAPTEPRHTAPVKAAKPANAPVNKAQMTTKKSKKQETTPPTEFDETPIEISKQEIPAEVAAHYARWRQAILDAEILQRKF